MLLPEAAQQRDAVLSAACSCDVHVRFATAVMACTAWSHSVALHVYAAVCVP